MLVVGLAARASSGVDRVARRPQPRPGRPSAAPARRARRTRRGASFSTPTTTPSSTPRRRSPTGCASPAARRSRSPKSTRRRRACARPTAREVEFARRSGRHRRRLVGRRGSSGPSFRPQTKLALLEALRLPAATQAQVRESLAKLVAETSARRLPMTHVSRLDAPRLVPLRADPAEPAGPIDATILTEDGGTIDVPRRAGRSGPHRARRRADDPRAADRPARPADRPPPPDRRRRRMRARRRAARSSSRQGGAQATLRRLGAALCAEARTATRGSATSPRSAAPARWRARPARRFSASARCTTCSRATASAPVPTTRRTDASSTRSSSTRSTPAACPTTRSAPPRSPRSASQIEAASAAPAVEYSPAWAIKREALAARYAAFARAPRGPAGRCRSSPTTTASSPPAARRCGASRSSRRSRRGAAARIGGAGLRRCATANATRSPRRRRGIRGGRLRHVQPMARRPPARRRGGAGESGRARDRLLSRSRGRRRARRRRELGARRGVGAQRHRRRAARSVLDPGPDLEPAAA